MPGLVNAKLPLLSHLGTVLMGLGLFIYNIVLIRVIISGTDTIYLWPAAGLMATGCMLFFYDGSSRGYLIGALASGISGITLLIQRLRFLESIGEAAHEMSLLGGKSSELIHTDELPFLKDMTLALAIGLLCVAAALATLYQLGFSRSA